MPCHVEGAAALALGLEENAVLRVALPLVDVAEPETAEPGVVGHMTNIGDVLDELHVQSGGLGASADEVGEEEGPHVSDVGVAVHRGPAGVHAQDPRRGRDHLDDRASRGVIEVKGCGRHGISFDRVGLSRA